MLSVLLVDDHPVVRQGLRQILTDEFPDAEFGEAGDSEEALLQNARKLWDIIILDINIPGRTGLDVLKEMRQQKPDCRVLVLTIYPEEQYARRFLRAGACGYMTKDRARSELVRAFRKVLSGGKYISPMLADKMAEGTSGSSERLHETLSDRELKVMLGLAAGKRLTDIAREMDLSIKTVSTYKHRIMEKMQMKVNADLTRYAIEHGLI